MLSTVVIFLLSVYSLEGFWSVAKMVSNSKLCWLRSEFTEKAWENAVRGLGTLKPHDHPRRPESCPNVSDPLFQNEAKCKDATSKKLCLLENVIWDCNNFKSKTRDLPHILVLKRKASGNFKTWLTMIHCKSKALADQSVHLIINNNVQKVIVDLKETTFTTYNFLL